MINYLVRRLQKYSLLFKILGFLFGGICMFALIYFTQPNILNIVVASFLLWLTFFSLLSIFINPRIAFLLSVGVGFFTFLKAVDLLTIVNIVLLISFLVLLALYFRKPKVEQKESDVPTQHRKDVLFPKGWPFKVVKKKPEV